MTNIRAISTQLPIVKTFTGAATLALLGVLAFGVSGASAQLPAVITDGDDDAYGEAVCVVRGAAGTAQSPVDSVRHDMRDDDEAWDPDLRPTTDEGVNLMDTDGGVFDFTTEPADLPNPERVVVCAGTDEGGEVIGAVAGTDFEINAGTNGVSRGDEGEYTNLVCGTGHAEGTADLWRGDPIPAGLHMGQRPTDLKTRFAIDFVGGIGPLAITSFEGHVSLDNPIVPDDLDGTPDPEDPENLAGDPDVVQDVDTGWGKGVVHIAPNVLAEDGGARREGRNGDVNWDGEENGPNDPPAGPETEDDDPGDPGPPPPPLPGDPFPCVDGGVTEFVVDAAFVATLSGDTDVDNDANE